MDSSSLPLAARIRGSLLGLAVCDALGGPVEFRPRGSFPRITTLLPNGNFQLPAGCFTDDTSMALCLAQSLLDHDGRSNTPEQARKYISWWQSGYMSSTGTCFDIGVSTCAALAKWSAFLDDSSYLSLEPSSPAATQAKAAHQESIDDAFIKDNFCGNGSLMRVVPTALIAVSQEAAEALARQSSETTHPHKRCVEACAMYSVAVWKALQGLSKEELAASLLQNTQVTDEVLTSRFKPYKALKDWDKPQDTIHSTGYVADSLEAALWAFFTTDSFQDGAIRAVNLGDDADTIGAIYGGLAGAYYGVDHIPTSWLDGMKNLDLVQGIADQIVARRARQEEQSTQSRPVPTQTTKS